MLHILNFKMRFSKFHFLFSFRFGIMGIGYGMDWILFRVSVSETVNTITDCTQGICFLTRKIKSLMVNITEKKKQERDNYNK